MKYIRTKDGKIYLINKDLFEEDTFHFTNKDGVATILIEKQNLSILGKVADTIEELCDEFIVVSDNCKKPIISALPYNELKLYAKNRTKYATCYGAIWTDKGLIYVAKMNDKGELELL